MKTLRGVAPQSSTDPGLRTSDFGLRIACSLILSGLAMPLSVCLAQEQPEAYECRRATGAIAIDGVLDEESWAQAQRVGGFRVSWEDRAAKSETNARLLWDDKALYFAGEMTDADLYADVLEHDGMTWLNDVFEMFFKPHEDQRGYYEFQVNAANTRMDMFLPARGAGGYGRFARDGDFHLKSAVALDGTLNRWRDTDRGWLVEGSIPWSDFADTGGRPKPGDVWRYTLCRYDYATAYERPELSTCAPLTVGDFHRYEDYARIRFVGE